MRISRNVFFWLSLVATLSGCRGCVKQHDPRPDWKKFEQESAQANKTQPVLNEDGSMPSAVPALVAEIDPHQKKYNDFCANCHGADGGGNGPAGSALNPKPRNFITWNDPAVTDEYIHKIIKEGGTAVGKSATMAAWGGILSDDEITALVKIVRAYKK
jgi:mono/diheme cytochrome c family protein